MKLIYISICILISLIFSPTHLFSQEEETKDTTIYYDEDYEINIDEIEDNWDEFFDFKEFHRRKASHPFIKVRGGLNQFSHKLAKNNFRQLGNFTLQLGYTRSIKNYNPIIFSIRDRYVGISLSNKNLYKSATPEPNQLSNFQIQLGLLKSFGYKFKNTKIIFGNGKEINWTKTSFDISTIGIDSTLLDLYRDAIRFGEAYNSEFSIQLFDFISLQGNYNFGVIFPRHLFWKHLGSFVIEEVAKSFLEDYIKKVFEMRPAAGPIVNFILKSSLDYLFYEFKKEKMNWPFNSTQPLTYDTYSFGLKFTF